MNAMTAIVPLLIVFFAVNIFIYLIISSRFSQDASVSSLTHQTISNSSSVFDNSKSRRGGLYKDSQEIEELWSLEDVSRLANSREPVIIIFYASWCPHCRLSTLERRI